MKKILFLFLTISYCTYLQAQTYTDYIGAGHNNGMTVITSSQFQADGNWSESASGEQTINGAGLDEQTMIYSRFLGQATLGTNLEQIEYAKSIGMEGWLEEQFNIEPSSLLNTIWEVFYDINQFQLENGVDPNDIAGRPWAYHFNSAWWTVNMTNEDLLRQRVALALSEIMVISNRSDLDNWADGVAHYYDKLAEHAFGNFEDLLLDITLHPAMGFYLSHLNNPRSFPGENQHPDENYAREVMQLFSIGLFELNEDGTRQTDSEGHFIPTYDNNDIKEFAKIFTGLGAGGVLENEWVSEPEFWLWMDIIDLEEPMNMYEEYHQPGEKHLLNGYTVPAGQTGIQDIEDAVHHLFSHQNVGPFIGRLLIQRLVKSNPSPEYIARVTAAFNDNGQGVRGDMKAVISAILLDQEARSCEAMVKPLHGMLREPIVRYTHFFRAMDNISPQNRYWNPGYDYLEDTGQYPMYSPSVFNFFSPNYQPIGGISDNDIVAPEFELHNSRTSIGYINHVNTWTLGQMPFYTWEENNPQLSYEIEGFKEMVREPHVFLNYLDKVYTHGQLTTATRDIIHEAMLSLDWPWDREEEREYRVKIALYLLFSSPDYSVFK